MTLPTNVPTDVPTNKLRNVLTLGPTMLKNHMHGLDLNKSWLERYNSKTEFALELISPIIASIYFPVSFVLNVLQACIQAVIALLKAVAGLCVLPFNKQTGKRWVADAGERSIEVVGALNNAIFDIFMFALGPVSLVRTATRSVATLFSSKKPKEPMGGVGLAVEKITKENEVNGAGEEEGSEDGVALAAAM